MFNYIDSSDKEKYNYNQPIYQCTRSKKSYDTPLLLNLKKNRVRVSPSKLYNYISGNKIKDVIKNDDEKSFSELSLIRINNGNEYEKQIIRKICNNPIIVSHFLNEQSVEYGKKLIIEGLKLENTSNILLFQVPLLNKYNNTGGISDILVRSDFIEKIFKIYYPFKHEQLHYVIIDIKYSNNTSQYHKSQLYIYNQSLKHIQKYETKCSYVYKKNNIIEVIDWKNNEIQITKEAINWCRRLHLYRKFEFSNELILKKENIQQSPQTQLTPIYIQPNHYYNKFKYIHYVVYYYINLDDFSLEYSYRKPFLWYISIMTQNLETDYRNVKYFFTNGVQEHEENKIISNVYHILNNHRGNVVYWSQYQSKNWFPHMYNLHRKFPQHSFNELKQHFYPNLLQITDDKFMVNSWKYLKRLEYVNTDIFKDYSDVDVKLLYKLYNL